MQKQIQLRSVNPLWAGEAIQNCELVKSLVLWLRSEPAAANPDEELQQRIGSVLGFNWDEKDVNTTLTPSQFKVLQISETHWNKQTIESIGRLFGNIKLLGIYDDTAGAEAPDIDKYGTLWSLLPNVDALILCIQSPITSEDFLVRLFGPIEQHLAPLEALNVRIESQIQFTRLPPENIAKTTQFMRNFALTCSVANLAEIIQMVGRDLHTRPTKKILPIRELEVDVPLIREEQVGPMFELNLALAQVTWLKLNKVTNLKVVSALLEQSSALEKLYLNKQRQSDIYFGNELFTAVSKLAHLRILMLFRFDIFDFGTINKAHPITQIRELLINKHGLFEQLLADWRKKNDALLDQNGAPRSVDTLYPALGESVEAIVRPFVSNAATLFPNLEVFILVTNLAFVDKVAFKQWCNEEFKCAKICGISSVPNRIFRD